MRAIAIAFLLAACGTERAEPPPRIMPERPSEPVATPTPTPTPTPAPAPSPEPTPDADEPVAPSVPSVARVELPAGDPRVLAPLPTKMGNRIRRELRLVHHARIDVRESLYLRSPDGRGVVYALTEIDEHEACMNAPPAEGQPTPAREERTQSCASLREGPGAPCTEQMIVRIDFEPPAANRPPDWGGTLHVAHKRPVELGCHVASVRAFTLRDVDGDSRLELEVDLIGVTEDITDRGEVAYEVRSRTLAYYREDLSPQFEGRLTDVGCDCEQMTAEMSAERVTLHDENTDGHADLVVEDVSYETSGSCSEDETGWPRLDPDEDATECAGAVTTEHWLYDVAADTWPEP